MFIDHSLQRDMCTRTSVLSDFMLKLQLHSAHIVICNGDLRSKSYKGQYFVVITADLLKLPETHLLFSLGKLGKSSILKWISFFFLPLI